MLSPSEDIPSGIAPSQTDATTSENNQEDGDFVVVDSKSSEFKSGVKEAAAHVVNETKKSLEKHISTVKRAVSRPAQIVTCAGCGASLPCPPDLFDSWVCKNGHTVSSETNPSRCHVEDCGDEKPADYIHSLRCLRCQHITVVDTELVSWVKRASGKVATAAREAVDETVRTSKFMMAQPETFNCSQCNTELHNPILLLPTWRCQVCSNDNARETKECVQCKHKRSNQRVICGVCNKSTPVPTRNIGNLLTRQGNEITSGMTKVLYNISLQPWVSCPRCRNPCKIHKAVLEQIRSGLYPLNEVHSVCKICHVQFSAQIKTIKGIPIFETLTDERKVESKRDNTDVEETTTMAAFIGEADSAEDGKAVENVFGQDEEERSDESLEDEGEGEGETVEQQQVQQPEPVAVAQAVVQEPEAEPAAEEEEEEAVEDDVSVTPQQDEEKKEEPEKPKGPTKLCSICSETKPKADFSKSQYAKANGKCRVCIEAQ